MKAHFSSEDREQEACQNCRFLRCRGYKEAKIIFALLHLLPGMSYPLQYLVISLRMRWLDNCTGLRSAGATRSAVLCPWGGAQGGSQVDTVSLILRLHSPHISCQP